MINFNKQGREISPTKSGIRNSYGNSQMFECMGAPVILDILLEGVAEECLWEGPQLW